MVNRVLTPSKGVISDQDTAQFRSVLDKLSQLTDRHRRQTKCWIAMRQLLEQTGNWKNAKRGSTKGLNRGFSDGR